MTNTIILAIQLIYLAETNRGVDKYDEKGPMQITRGFVDDCNRIVKFKKYKYSDRKDLAFSQLMVIDWLTYYKAKAEKRTGQPCNEYDLAMLYNRGYRGYLRGEGTAYLDMIKRKLIALDKNDTLRRALKS